MLRRFSCAIHMAVLVLCIGSAATAQENAGQGISELLRGNERFGRKLLQQVHAGSPDRNVVVSPISLSLLLLAIQVNSGQERTHKEIGDTFGWGAYPHLRVPARMLMAAFEAPEAKPPELGSHSTPPDGHYAPQEAAWITNTILYRSTHIKEPIAEHFIASATKDFGVKFVNTGKARPVAADLRRARKPFSDLPKVFKKNDLWISSGTHFQTAWGGNTFSMSKPHPGEFHTATGQAKAVEVLDSELEGYLYAKTGSFEAVALPCNLGYLLAVLRRRARTSSI